MANSGTIAWYNSAKGYGFVRVDGVEGDDQDVFLHKTQVEHCRNDMYEGTVLAFDVEVTDKGGEARNVTVVEAAERAPRLTNLPANGLHIGGLSLDTTNEDLENLFKDFATTHVEVVASRAGANFAHACVCVEFEEDMDAAIEALDKTVLKGNEIFVQVRRAGAKKKRRNRNGAAAAAATEGGNGEGATKKKKKRKRKKRDAPVFPPNALYIGNLSWGVEDDAFAKLFADFDTTYAEVQRISNGRSRGYGVVCLTNAEDMDTVIAQWNGKAVDGRELLVEVRHGGEGGDKAAATGEDEQKFAGAAAAE